MRVLIVDDDIFVRKCIGAMIPWASLGFDQLFEADNGATALEIAMREKPDIVISDVKMPILNGLEFSQKLGDTMVDTYIIILSEYSDFEYVHQALGYGVKDYILKPFTKERIVQITEKIKKIVESHEKKRYYDALLTDRIRMQSLIREALERSDDADCRDLFESIASNRINADDIRRYCLLFIDALFGETSKVTFRKSELSALRREAFVLFDQLKNIRTMLSFSQDLCRQCVMLCNKHVKPVESYIQMILEYIEKHYDDPDLSVAKIADYLHLSPIYTGSLFKKHQGVSILAHIHEVRICHAIDLLKDLSLSIAQIGAKIGYLTSDYFTKVFKKSTGLVPSEYRSMILLQSP